MSIKHFTVKDWTDGKIVIEGIEIPPLNEDTQTQLRHKRKIGYRKFAGRVYYDTNHIKEYMKNNTVEVVS